MPRCSSLGAVAHDLPVPVDACVTSITPGATSDARARRSSSRTRSLRAYLHAVRRLPVRGGSSQLARGRRRVDAAAARHRRRWRRTGSPGCRSAAAGVVFALYLATMMVPLQVLIVPLFIEMKTLEPQTPTSALLAADDRLGVRRVPAAAGLRPRCRVELDEAATHRRRRPPPHLRQIILPLIRPALATLAVFAFMGSWNSFLWPLVVIRSPEFMTLPARPVEPAGPVHDPVGRRHGRLRLLDRADRRSSTSSPSGTSSPASPTPASSRARSSTRIATAGTTS